MPTDPSASPSSPDRSIGNPQKSAAAANREPEVDAGDVADESGKLSRMSMVVIKPRSGWVPIDFGELWQFRELAWFIAMRDVKVRYKQTVLGLLWAVIPPFFTMVAFNALFTLMGTKPVNPDSHYAVTMYCAMLPWQLFATSMAGSSNSLVSNANLIKKVYFPRIITPLAPLVVSMVDHLIAFSVLIGLMVWYGVTPTWAILTLPFFMALALAASLSISLWLSALNAIYRDIRYTVPVLIQFGMYASPVIYETQALIPEKWQTLYALNPMAGVIEGYRWALLGKQTPPDPMMILLSVVVVLVMLFGGMFYFRRMERTFADLV